MKAEDHLANDTRDASYVVGIGASAGGLEAIHELFDNMPDDTNFSFVIVQHLSPDYKSLMVELLSKHTNMQVYEATDKLALQPNSVYVIPTKKRMTLQNGALRLTEKANADIPNTAIDTFFTSLAEEKGTHAIAIVLSGTGTDGSRGIVKIKEKDGIVIVQDPISAKFDGMPNSAIATGTTDLILAPELIAEELAEYLKEGPLTRAFKNLALKDEGLVNQILETVKFATQHDFLSYKRPTIGRRISKRMLQLNIQDLKGYLEYLRAHPEESKFLSKEFLIGVTKFFRDEAPFEELKTAVLPSLISGRKENEGLKAWVVACSTGEEAYSMAMVFTEYLKSNSLSFDLKIFATDIDKAAIDIATKGVYPETIANDVSKERLDKFFIREGNTYKVVPELRRMIVFAHHDILKDPPFSKLDFLSCRNMLIYMNSDLQKNVLRTFHFSLNENAFLLLGPSENIGVIKDSMKEVDKKWKIYKNLIKARLSDRSTFGSPTENRTPTQFISTVKSKNALSHISEIFKDILVAEYNYAGIYITEDFEVKHADGNFKQYLNFPAGKFNFNLLKMVPADLSIALGAGVRKALKLNEKVVLESIKWNEGKDQKLIKIIIQPYIQLKEYLQPFIFIVLQEVAINKEIAAVETSDLALADVAILATELKETRENLQTVVEELESANEELQSSNEEMLSSNEELQSTNEELQSLNEELHTVNAEHQLKIRELVELNDDLNNYFRSSEMGQILIDKNLIIKKFSPVTKSLINLKEADISRNITDFSHNIRDIEFIKELQYVIRTGKQVEKDVQVTNGKTFQMRIIPYLRMDNENDGVVITFFDITHIRHLSSLIEGVFDSSLNAVAGFRSVRDADNKITDFQCIVANKAATRLGLTSSDATNQYLLSENSLIYAQDHFQKYVEVVNSGFPLHFEYLTADGKNWFELLAAKMQDGFVFTVSNISDAKKTAILLDKGYNELLTTSDKLKQSNLALEQSNFDLLQFASVASHDLKEPLRKIQIFGERLHESLVNKLTKDEEEYLQKMMKSSERMKTLIDDLLSISKLSNKSDFFTQVNLNDIITAILDDLEVTIKEKNAKIIVEPLPTINAISGQTRQLFQNIITNSMKYCTTSPSIKISNSYFDFNGRKMCSLRFEDNGIGFEDKYKEKIFGIFQRLHAKGEYEGTGIGLAICKKIVDNHQGSIWAESKPGKGSVFTIQLPV